MAAARIRHRIQRTTNDDQSSPIRGGSYVSKGFMHFKGRASCVSRKRRGQCGKVRRGSGGENPGSEALRQGNLREGKEKDRGNWGRRIKANRRENGHAYAPASMERSVGESETRKRIRVQRTRLGLTSGSKLGRARLDEEFGRPQAGSPDTYLQLCVEDEAHARTHAAGRRGAALRSSLSLLFSVAGARRKAYFIQEEDEHGRVEQPSTNVPPRALRGSHHEPLGRRGCSAERAASFSTARTGRHARGAGCATISERTRSRSVRDSRNVRRRRQRRAGCDDSGNYFGAYKEQERTRSGYNTPEQNEPERARRAAQQTSAKFKSSYNQRRASPHAPRRLTSPSPGPGIHVHAITKRAYIGKRTLRAPRPPSAVLEDTRGAGCVGADKKRTSRDSWNVRRRRQQRAGWDGSRVWERPRFRRNRERGDSERRPQPEHCHAIADDKTRRKKRIPHRGRTKACGRRAVEWEDADGDACINLRAGAATVGCTPTPGSSLRAYSGRGLERERGWLVLVGMGIQRDAKPRHWDQRLLFLPVLVPIPPSAPRGAPASRAARRGDGSARRERGRAHARACRRNGRGGRRRGGEGAGKGRRAPGEDGRDVARDATKTRGGAHERQRDSTPCAVEELRMLPIIDPGRLSPASLHRLAAPPPHMRTPPPPTSHSTLHRRSVERPEFRPVGGDREAYGRARRDGDEAHGAEGAPFTWGRQKREITTRDPEQNDLAPVPDDDFAESVREDLDEVVTNQAGMTEQAEFELLVIVTASAYMYTKIVNAP
ncbi:hypothetical protein FB451DRAFT_1519097 [Mycena latifolia]|nr:hypothetical protein FB451DRAFT_1519097 [Mycena latifolia]